MWATATVRLTKARYAFLLYGHYRIAYLYRLDNESVEILGVFHGALDIDRYFP